MHARVTLHCEAGVEEAATRVADVRARLSVDCQYVLALYGFGLERGATDVTDERTTAAVNRLVVR